MFGGWRRLIPASPFIYLGWLYLVQGIPYGLQDKFIPAQLRSLGLNYSSVSLLKLLLVPWLLKGLWAPIVEVFGGRQRWLIASLMALAAASYTGSLITPDDVGSVVIILLGLNMGYAVQDVAVNGLALDIIPDHLLGLANTIQGVLYRIGSLVGGAGLTQLLDLTSWSTTFTVLASVYVFTVVLAALSHTEVSIANTPTSKNQEECVNQKEFMEKEGNMMKDNEYMKEDGYIKEGECVKQGEFLKQEEYMKKEGNMRKDKECVKEDWYIKQEKSMKEDSYINQDEYMKQKIDSSTTENVKNRKQENDKLPVYKNPSKHDPSRSIKRKFEKAESQERKKGIVSIIKEVIYSPGMLWLTAYVLVYKMGERGAINNIPLFLLDHGFSKQELAFWNGTVCQALLILGSFVGGVILSKPNVSIKSILIKHSIYRLISVIIQCLVVLLIEEGVGGLSEGEDGSKEKVLSGSGESLSGIENIIGVSLSFNVLGANTNFPNVLGVASMCWLNYSCGIISTVSFTLMMKTSRECSRESQASHYSVVASLEMAGKLVFASLAGFIIDYLGMLMTFYIFAFLCTLPVLILTVMPDRLCYLRK